MAAYPTSSRQRSDSSPSPPPSIPLANRSSQPPRLTASSSASQQLPNNAGPDNRLPCRLQVCQPWACQITVSVNRWGWGWRRGKGAKRRGAEWRELSRTYLAGRDGEEEDDTYGHTCRKRSGIYSVHVDRGTHRRCAVILNIVTGLMQLYAGARKLLLDFVFYLHCISETSV